MTAEIKTKKTGSKWHGLIEGRPDIDETGLTEEVARRKVESVRERLGNCGSRTRLFGGRTCELVRGHIPPVGQRLQHQSGTIVGSTCCRRTTTDERTKSGAPAERRAWRAIGRGAGRQFVEILPGRRGLQRMMREKVTGPVFSN